MRAGPGAGLALSLGLLLAAAALPSCTSAAPELLAVEARLEERPSEGGSYESLSVFGDVRDSDGLDDIEALWVVNDEAELSWQLDDTNWTALSESGETWLGGAGLSMADYGPLPRGRYRLVIANLAGKRAEASFELPEAASPRLGRRALPSLGPLSGGKANAVSTWPQNFLLAYDAAGSLIASKPLTLGGAGGAGGIDLGALLGPQLAAKAASIGLYGYDPTALIGAYSWRTKTR